MDVHPQSNEHTLEEPLLHWLRDLIASEGPITFRDFMAHALYHPQYGYYTGGPNIGPRGDFVTSPEASPAFGKLFAGHLADIDRLLGSPAIFHAVEFGPGRGTLALDLLDEARSSYPELYARLNYWLVDVSPALRALQESRLMPEHGERVEWRGDINEMPVGLEGAVIGNEVVDAFPVNVLENWLGTVREQYVALDAKGELVIQPGLVSDPRLGEFLIDAGIELGEGERVEVNLAAEDWMHDLGSLLERGVVTLIDYGDEAPARYSPARREGTLLGYYSGAVTDALVAHPGKQDLTALVDFTALRRDALRAGFAIAGSIRQANFLLGLGLGTTHTVEMAVPEGTIDDIINYRRGIQSLVSMDGLGRFHVLLLSKGVATSSAQQELSALKYTGF